MVGKKDILLRRAKKIPRHWLPLRKDFIDSPKFGISFVTWTWILRLSKQIGRSWITLALSWSQVSANRGPDSTFIDKMNSARPSPKPRQSLVIILMDWTWVTRPRGEYWVDNTLIIVHFWLIRQVITHVLFSNSETRLSYSPKFGWSSPIDKPLWFHVFNVKNLICKDQIVVSFQLSPL